MSGRESHTDDESSSSSDESSSARSASSASAIKHGYRAPNSANPPKKSRVTLSPYMYPAGSFHMPTIVDAPRRRNGIADYYLVSKLRSSAPPKERTRAPPERLNIATFSKKPKLDPVVLVEEAEAAAAAAAASSASKSAGKAAAAASTSGSATKSTSTSKPKSVSTPAPAAAASASSFTPQSKPKPAASSSASAITTKSPAVKPPSFASTKSSTPGPKPKMAKVTPVVESGMVTPKPTVKTAGGSPRSNSPPRSASAPSPPNSGAGFSRKRSANGSGAGGNSKNNPTPINAATMKRLALERLDLTRSRSVGANLNGLRNTRLAAAASMVVEADFADEPRPSSEETTNNMFATGPSPANHRYMSRSPTPSPPPQANDFILDDDVTMTDAVGHGLSATSASQDVSSTVTIHRLSPPPALTSTPALPDCFTSQPRLSESALSRLALSNTNKATYLSFEWVYKRCQKYLCLKTPEAQRQQDELLRNSSSKEYTSKAVDCATLANGRVYVAVSKRSDHNLLWLDDQTKAEANRAAAGVTPSQAKWIQLRDEDEMRDGLESGASKAIPMLGLFAAQDFPAGTWLTEYGGVLEWGGNGEASVKNRAKECNTHVRRICNTDFVWNGRPWSMLFPRIPSFLEREMKRPLEQRTHLAPTVTNRTLINLLLLLHHEEQTHTLAFSHAPHDRQKNSQLPFTARDMRSATVCQGTCLLCRNEMNIVLNGLGGRNSVGDLTHDDLLATFLPQCACCSVTCGLLPCEIHEIFSKWSTADQEALWSLCEKLQHNWIANGGLGYMANTDSKARQNVRVFSKSPYVPAVSDMHPLVHIYQATRHIAEGEEIVVAYNNNESKHRMSKSKHVDPAHDDTTDL